jgi:hypothetical protein
MTSHTALSEPEILESPAVRKHLCAAKKLRSSHLFNYRTDLFDVKARSQSNHRPKHSQNNASNRHPTSSNAETAINKRAAGNATITRPNPRLLSASGASKRAIRIQERGYQHDAVN